MTHHSHPQHEKPKPFSLRDLEESLAFLEYDDESYEVENVALPSGASGVSSTPPPKADDNKAAQAPPKDMISDSTAAVSSPPVTGSEKPTGKDPSAGPAVSSASIPLEGGESKPRRWQRKEPLSSPSSEDKSGSGEKSRPMNTDKDFEEAKISERKLREAILGLDSKLHKVGSERRERVYFWCRPLISEMARIMGAQLGLPTGQLVEQALLSFYRNEFTPERGLLSDLIVHTDQLALAVSEHTTEMLHLEELAATAIDAERSPRDAGEAEIGGGK